MYARNAPTEGWRRVVVYAVLGQSGGLGPKLAEGDKQVPEGVYEAEYLNANSRFHLSIRLNYPNAFDREMAQRDGRTTLGSDIMIHGTDSSIGCLAVGNQAAEDLFVLAGHVRGSRVRVLISPTDFRTPSAQEPSTSVPWSAALYGVLRDELRKFPGGA